MNVVFWSPVPGLAKVSSSMLSIALCTATEYRVMCSISQLHFGKNGLIQPILVSGSDTDLYFENTGIGALIRAAKGGTVSPEMVENCSVSFLEKKLNVFTASNYSDERIYRGDLLQAIEPMFEAMKETFKINFIDVPAGINAYSKAAIKHADFVAVCLPQTQWVIDKFWSDFEMPKDKTFYVFGDCDPAEFINAKNFAWRNRKLVNSKYCLNVPHCTDFANAINRGKAISFVMQNLHCKLSDSNYVYMKDVKASTKSILKACKVLREV